MVLPTGLVAAGAVNVPVNVALDHVCVMQIVWCKIDDGELGRMQEEATEKDYAARQQAVTYMQRQALMRM